MPFKFEYNSNFDNILVQKSNLVFQTMTALICSDIKKKKKKKTRKKRVKPNNLAFLYIYYY